MDSYHPGTEHLDEFQAELYRRRFDELVMFGNLSEDAAHLLAMRLALSFPVDVTASASPAGRPG